MAIKPITLKDVEKMARDLMKDPAAKASIEKDFKKLIGEQVGDKRSDTELNKMYENLKKNFEHLITPLGSEDNDKE